MILVVLAMLYVTAKAQKEVYSVEYDATSPLKNIALKNQEIKIAVYSNGTPKGYQSLSTNDKAQFSLDLELPQPVAIEILSIKNQEKAGAACYGATDSQSNIIKITCSYSENKP